MPKAQRVGLLQLALAKHQAGDLDSAIALYRQLLAIDGSDPDCLNLLGVALHASGRSEEAVECLRLAARKRRKDPALHYNLGTVLADCGDFAAAESALRTALQLGSREAHLEMNLANAIALQGRLRQALPFYEAATKRAPRSAHVWLNYGNALRDLGEAAKALESYRKSVALAPADPAAWTNLGHVLHRLERIEEAEDAYRKALSAGGADAEIQRSLAQLLLQQARPTEALEFAQKALALQPGLVDALIVLGRALRALFRFDEAEAALRCALERAPGSYEASMRLAELLRDTGRAQDALSLYESMANGPQDEQRRSVRSRAVALMLLHRFAEGWADMQARVARERLEEHQPEVAWANCVLPDQLEGKTIYVQREQGLGDELFYLRFMPGLRARGARVLYSCGEKLQALLARVQIAERVESGMQPAPDAQVWLSVGDLPWALEAGTKVAATPAALPLVPLPERVRAMRAQLNAAGPGPYIGITWRAGTPPERQPGIRGRVLWKSIDHRSVGQALATVDGTLIALQREPRVGELEELSNACGRPVHDFNAWNEDLDDAVALQAALDDYVGVSNTNMHLRAGLGLSGKVLLTFPPDWRWIEKDASCLFFPGFRLYRQARDGGWRQALERLREDLCAQWGVQDRR